jgi:UPF0271 protein
LKAARAEGLRAVAEVFADRAYESDGSLRPRTKPDAVIHDSKVVVARALRMVKAGVVEAIDGTIVPIEAETICVHGDTAGAAVLVAELRAGLETAGVLVLPIGRSQESAR